MSDTGTQLPIYFNGNRQQRLRDILAYLRKNSVGQVSRSEAVGQAIDLFFLQNCLSEAPKNAEEKQLPGANTCQ